MSYTHFGHNGDGYYDVSFYDYVYTESDAPYHVGDAVFNVRAQYLQGDYYENKQPSDDDWGSETWGGIELIYPAHGGAGVPVVALRASADNPALDAADAALAAGIATDSRGAGFARVVDQPGVGGVGAMALDLGAYELQAGPFGPVTSPVTIEASGSGAPGASPHFTVYADGVVIGSVSTPISSATLGAAAYETFTFSAPAAPQSLEIVFDNDGRAADGTDINLRIGEVSLGGETYVPGIDGTYVRATGEDLGPQRSLNWNGTLSFEAPPRAEQLVKIVAGGTGDADGAPMFRVYADGALVGEGEIANPAAHHRDASFDTFVFRYAADAPAETVSVEFYNDQRTLAGVDVNLLVREVAFGGESYKADEDGAYIRDRDGADLGSTGAMWWNGALSFGDEAIGLVGWVNSRGGQAQALAVEGRFAYVGDSGVGGAPARFQTIDVSDPAHPVLRGSYRSAGNQEITEIDVAGSFVYMSNDANGVVKLDVSKPDAPRFVASRSDGGYASDFDSEDGRHGYATYEYAPGHEMSVYNLAVFPAAPLAQYDAWRPDSGGSQHAARIDVVGERAYMTGHTYDGVLDRPYLEIVDIADPARPTQVARLSLPTTDYGNYSGEVEYADGFVFVARSLVPGSGLTVPGGLVIVDARDEAAPVVAAAVRIPDATGTALPGGALGPGLEVVGDVAYLAARSGLYVFDVSDPYAPTIVVDPNVDDAFAHPDAFLPSLGGEVEIEGRYAYVTAHGAGVGLPGGLSVFRLPENPGDPAAFSGFDLF